MSQWQSAHAFSVEGFCKPSSHLVKLGASFSFAFELIMVMITVTVNENTIIGDLNHYYIRKSYFLRLNHCHTQHCIPGNSDNVGHPQQTEQGYAECVMDRGEH